MSDNQVQGVIETSDNCSLAYTVDGPVGPGAPRVVLIHSLALDRSIWRDVVRELCPHATVLTYDCRGHGRSGRPVMTYAPELFARDLSDLLEHLGWPRATVVGCSMGGCVAQAFAGNYGHKVEALGLIDTTAWYGPQASKTWRERAAAARAEGLGALLDFQLTRWFSDDFRATRPEVGEALSQVFLANDVECYAATCEMLGDADLRHYAPSLAMPVSVIVGEEDYATPIEMARRMHEAIPGSTLDVLAGARHLAPVEQPQRIAQLLAKLIARAA